MARRTGSMGKKKARSTQGRRRKESKPRPERMGQGSPIEPEPTEEQ